MGSVSPINRPFTYSKCSLLYIRYILRVFGRQKAREHRTLQNTKENFCYICRNETFFFFQFYATNEPLSFGIWLCVFSAPLSSGTKISNTTIPSMITLSSAITVPDKSPRKHLISDAMINLSIFITGSRVCITQEYIVTNPVCRKSFLGSTYF